jgi:glycosyltransferase involved in cell wall biosynthesis
MLLNKISAAYSRITGGADERNKNIHGGQGVASLLFSMPFFSPVKYLFLEGQKGLSPLASSYPAGELDTEKRILWFTDTINDLNGPSVTLKKLGWLAHEKKLKLNLVSSLLEEEMTDELPPNFVNLPFLYAFKLPYYDKYTLKIPALIRALKLIRSYKPDEIFISTPGPVGLFGLMAANILHVKKVGIYHTDFYLQSRAVVGNGIIPYILERLMIWFYNSMDEIHVPTREYMDITESRGYDRSKMRIFRRGLDCEFFSMKESGKTLLMERFGIRDGVTILFTGRMSKDKNLDLLLEAYRRLTTRKKNVNLLLVGDGPYIETIKKTMRGFDRVVLTGKLEQSVLPDVYAGSDMFVFPSIADTFGMSVLEAQACGLPAVVSEAGGPKEIIIRNETGLVASSADVDEWVRAIEYIIDLMENDFEAYIDMREKSRRNVLVNYNWDAVLAGLMGIRPATGEREIHIA